MPNWNLFESNGGLPLDAVSGKLSWLQLMLKALGIENPQGLDTPVALEKLQSVLPSLEKQFPLFDSKGFSDILNNASNAPMQGMFENLFKDFSKKMFMNTLLKQGFGLFGTVLSMRQQNDAIQDTREYALDLAKKQNEWNLHQWHMENEYNHPANQIRRLNEAGLNPNMIYGNGAGSLASAPSPAMTSGQGPTEPSYAGADIFLKMLEAMQNYENSELDKELKKAQIRNVNTDTAGKATDNTYKPLLNERTIDKLAAEVNNINENTLASAFDRFFQSAEWELMRDKWQLEKQQITELINQLVRTNKIGNEFDRKNAIAKLVNDWVQVAGGSVDAISEIIKWFFPKVSVAKK